MMMTINMKSFVAALATLALVKTAFGFSVDSAVVMGDGKDFQNPAKQGSTISLRCNVKSSSGDTWTYCSWSHTYKNEYDENRQLMMVQCDALQKSTGIPCDNLGGSPQKMETARRIKMDVSASHCGIVISNAQSSDAGKWDCSLMSGAPGHSAQQNSVDLFVANQSVPHISYPDVFEDSRAKVTYDLSSDKAMEVHCRGYNGVPKPTFRWFINDDRNEIRGRDLDVGREMEGSDPKYGDYVAQEMYFKPTLDQLCNNYGLQAECKKDVFTFQLICRTEQNGNLFSKPMLTKSSVLVEARNSALNSAPSLLVMLLSALTLFRAFIITI